MKRVNAIELNAVLNTKELKVKNLNGEQYVKLLGLKRNLYTYLSEMEADEKELFKTYKIKNDDDLKTATKDFYDKLEAIQSKEFEYKTEPFLNIDEFKKLTDEMEFSLSFVLSEILLIK